ncbi:MAG TPA: carboxypeptidase-like regulatory domain-containing protein, partial [Parapedobacter sp.]|nr:carboxypeptidase-like regulatory domain-containing protein [Parapedobacter sp.]
MSGATVKEAGTNISVTTDAQGNFSIGVSSQQSALVISFIGYITREVTVGNTQSLTIMLEAEDAELEEV